MLLAGLCCESARAQNCSNLPTQFSGSEFPSGDFFTNFNNSCYLVPLAPQGSSKTDLNDTYWQIYYKVDPRYQLIVLGSFPNARYFSLTANDDHYLLSQSILDTNILPLTSSFVNPFHPGVPYAEGQQYAVAMNFGGTPGTQETGCMMNGYNVGVNALDATLRHQGINWNTDPGFWAANPTATLHIVDTPQHTNPNAAGYLMVRAYLDSNPTDPTTIPSVILRDVATGCAYPAAYALQTLEIVSPTGGSSWLDHNQFLDHKSYDANYLPTLCYGTDPQNSLSWARQGEVVKFPNSDSSYLTANVPAKLPSTLAAAGEVMRVRLRIPVTPPTPCTNGCSRSGNEQVRYVGLSFYPSSGAALASLADSYFTRDANGYATLIVGTGAAIPSWVTPANGYTFLDLTAAAGYNNLQFLELRDILAAATFACGAQVVPYKTSVYTSDGNMIGDYLPEVDYPLAASLPPVASELVGPGVCGVLPAGVPEVSPACGLLPPNPTVIQSIPAPAPGESPIAVQPLPPITLSGAGFGYLPNGLPYTGSSNYLQVTDLTQGWAAGGSGNPCNLSIGYWADNRIELVANVNENALCPLDAGDQITISVLNPQTGGTPVTSTLTVASDVTYALGTNLAVVGSAAGNGTVELITAGPWTATSNASWLHLSPVSISGTGSALIQFSYDANPNSGAQTGALTIAGLAFTVTQAGAGYVPIAPMTTLISSGLKAPQGVAVDPLGNVYIADTGNHAVEMWVPATQQLVPLVSSGLINPTGVAVDTYGNVYIADGGNQAIEQWNPATASLSALVKGLGSPYGVALDPQNNVYLSDSRNNVIDEWSALSTQLTTLAGGSAGVSDPLGVGVDGLGNVYFANTNDAIVQWNIAAQLATKLVASGTNEPSGVAVDGQGNVYFGDTGNNAVKQWNAASQQVLTLVSSGLNNPTGIALDAQGNLYIADQGNNAIKKVTFGYLALSAASLNEIAQAGSDSLSAQILPANTPLTATSDQSWLAISSVAGGSIGFTFQANGTGASRVAHILVMGQQVTVTQTGGTLGHLAKSGGDGQSTPTGQLFPSALQVTVTDINGVPMPGLAVTFTVTPGSSGAGATWSPSPPMPILTDRNGNAVAPALTANSIGGAFGVIAAVDGFNVTFNLTNLAYTLADSSATVGSAAGSGSVLLLAAGAWTATSNAPWLTLSSASQNGAGNAPIDFNYATNPNTTPRTGAFTIAGLTFTVIQAPAGYAPVDPVAALISSGLLAPRGLAADAAGNIYIADSLDGAIKEWSASTQQLITLVSAGLNKPSGVAVDGQGNVYFSDTGNNAIKEWISSTQVVRTLVATGLDSPIGVAVDGQGNVYFSDSGNNDVKEWFPATNSVTTLIPSGFRQPAGVALDAYGNLYIADSVHKQIKVWNALSHEVSTIIPTGFKNPIAVAVDGDGNVYIADSGSNSVMEWSAATQQLATMASVGLSSPSGIAVTAAGNVFIGDTNNNAVKLLTPAFALLSVASLNETQPAGVDSVTVQVFPATTPISATSGQAWLTVTGTTNGVIGLSFTANNTVNTRTSNLTVCGARVTVTQTADTAASIAKAAGTGQTVAPGLPFATALEVKIKDAAGQPVQGVPVTFTVVPGVTGASATFASKPVMPVLTNSSGEATAPKLTANSVTGVFTVSVVAGSLSATFTMKIVP